MIMGEVVYLSRGAADVAEAVDMINRTHDAGNIKAIVMTVWTNDGDMHFTSVGEMDHTCAVMESIGVMEHHKNFILNAYNAAMIARAQQLADEYDGRHEPPSAPA
jgi:hypothetical protein